MVFEFLQTRSAVDRSATSKRFYDQPSIDQRTLFDFVAMRVQQVTDKQHFFTRNQINILGVNSYLTFKFKFYSHGHLW